VKDNKNTGENKLVWKGVTGGHLHNYSSTVTWIPTGHLCTTHKTLVSKVTLNGDRVFTYLTHDKSEVREHNKNITRGSGYLHYTEKRRPIDDPSIVNMHRHKERKKSVK
jgi:hypothetical protein